MRMEPHTELNGISALVRSNRRRMLSLSLSLSLCLMGTQQENKVARKQSSINQDERPP
jgi:hypothetical protein